MEKYGVNELRKMFLEFMESKGHLAMKSFSLVPHNDNSILLINAGMTPLKPYFTGAEIPPRKRVLSPICFFSHLSVSVKFPGTLPTHFDTFLPIFSEPADTL